MEDLESMPAYEMLERRISAEHEVAKLIGQLVFSFSRLVQGLHLCVAWQDQGRQLDAYPSIAADLGAAALIRRIRELALARFGNGTEPYARYVAWSKRADTLREHRNIIMHSTWSIEAFGRHAIATSTPVFVEPVLTHVYSVQDLSQLCEACNSAALELTILRDQHPF